MSWERWWLRWTPSHSQNIGLPPPGPGPALTVLLVRIIGVVGHQLCIAWGLVVFFGHKYDSILP